MVCLDELIGTRLIHVDFDNKYNIIKLSYKNIRNNNIINKDYIYITFDSTDYTCYTDYFIKLAIITELLLNHYSTKNKRRFNVLKYPGQISIISSYTIKDLNKILSIFSKEHMTFKLFIPSYNIDKVYTCDDIKETVNVMCEDPDFVNNVLSNIVDDKISKEYKLHKEILQYCNIPDILRITKDNKILAIHDEVSSSAELYSSGIVDFLLAKASKNKKFFNNKFKISVNMIDDFTCPTANVLAFVKTSENTVNNAYNLFDELRESFSAKVMLRDDYNKSFSIKNMRLILNYVNNELNHRKYSCIKTIFGKIKLKYNKKDKSVSFWLKRGDNTK